MQSTLRSKVAVLAMLLVPAGAMLAAGPAAAQERFDGDRYHGQRWGHDRRAPEIFDLSPTQGDRVGDRGLTRIRARFEDNRSGVDPRSVILRVDGHDVTGASRVDADHVRFVGELRPGPHTAEVVVGDRAGNLTRRSWSFYVADHDRYGYGYGRRW